MFLETWMAGGLGRAQGGYDEMVFRAMVRDDAHFYDPLGLESRGHPRRLPGRRQRLSLRHALRHLARLHLSPEKVVAWTAARRGQRALLRRPVPARVRPAAGPGLAGLDRLRARFPARNLAEVRKFPITPAPQAGRARRSARSRACIYDEATGVLYGAVPLSRASSSTSARLNTRDGTCAQLADIKGAMLYRVTSLAYDPASGTAFYTDDNLALARPDGGRRRQTGDDAHAAEGRAHRRDRVQPGRPLAARRAPLERPGDAGAHSVPVRRSGPRCTSFPMGARARPISTSRPTAACCRRSMHRRQRRPVPARVGAREGARRAT